MLNVASGLETLSIKSINHTSQYYMEDARKPFKVVDIISAIFEHFKKPRDREPHETQSLVVHDISSLGFALGFEFRSCVNSDQLTRADITYKGLLVTRRKARTGRRSNTWAYPCYSIKPKQE